MADHGASALAHPGWKPLQPLNPEPPGIRRRVRMRKIIDNGRLVKRLWFVGASGFFAARYGFFASNVTKDAIYYVYPPCGRLNSNAAMVMDELTQIGSLIGMVVAGVLADLYGRKKLYGFELALLIIATLGIVQASEGFQSRRADGSSSYSMDIYSWLAWWQFWLGIAIGAEHPLVAIITAEWVRTKSRGRMLAGIFAVQSVARLAAYGVGLATLKGISVANGLSPDSPDVDEVWKHVADQVWRWVRGFLIIPAVLAVGFRLTIPETPLYYADIMHDTIKALKEMASLYPGKGQPEQASEATPGNDVAPPHEDIESPDKSQPEHASEATTGTDVTPRQENYERLSSWERFVKWYAGGKVILRTKAAGRNLFLLAPLWFCSEVAWYCLSLESPSAMSLLWSNPSTTASQSDTDPKKLCPEFLAWRSDPHDPNSSVYREMEHTAKSFMLVVCIGSILGSAALITIVNRVHRRMLLMVTCGALALLFAVCGAVLLAVGNTPSSPPESSVAIDVLFGMMHFLFVLGPRTLVLVVGAELFPTAYRGTFYGLFTAFGKVGSIAIRPIVGSTARLDKALGIRLMVAVALMVVCTVLSYFLPEVQRERQATDDEECQGEERKMTWVGPGKTANLFRKLETMTLEELETMALAERVTRT